MALIFKILIKQVQKMISFGQCWHACRCHCCHLGLSFIDGVIAYNQIEVHPYDAEKTAFRISIGNFHYTLYCLVLKMLEQLINELWFYFSWYFIWFPKRLFWWYCCKSKEIHNHVDDFESYRSCKFRWIIWNVPVEYLQEILRVYYA